MCFIHLLSTNKQDVLACGLTAAACRFSCELDQFGRGQVRESHLPQPQAPAEDVLASQQHCC